MLIFLDSRQVQQLKLSDLIAELDSIFLSISLLKEFFRAARLWLRG